MKKTNYRLSRDCCYDVVLCTTEYKYVDKGVTGALLRHAISFTRSEKKPSFVQRLRKRSRENIFVISVNRNEYFKAKRAIATLSPGLQERLSLNAI